MRTRPLTLASSRKSIECANRETDRNALRDSELQREVNEVQGPTHATARFRVTMIERVREQGTWAGISRSMTLLESLRAKRLQAAQFRPGRTNVKLQAPIPLISSGV
jgi:hypothetical protein